MDLSAEKAWNVDKHLDEELEKLLPLVRTEVRIGADLFVGGRIHRVIAGLAFLSPSPFLRGLGESLSDEEV
jgi:polysaccharide pyruvyl transferase WcaK-like protein